VMKHARTALVLGNDLQAHQGPRAACIVPRRMNQGISLLLRRIQVLHDRTKVILRYVLVFEAKHAFKSGHHCPEAHMRGKSLGSEIRGFLVAEQLPEGDLKLEFQSSKGSDYLSECMDFRCWTLRWHRAPTAWLTWFGEPLASMAL